MLHCTTTTNYPTLPEEVNLRVMITLKQAFGLPVGSVSFGVHLPLENPLINNKIVKSDISRPDPQQLNRKQRYCLME
ncbi:hypothetical protein DK28_0203430 [Peptococcaceae bacterium SCADC1_2_3]|nr:hypothetical protein DK28_0203430 [Peptococcaceae bacterium SCADC1_2_3]KFI35846.1 hypothetical protein HY00_00845 [Peptococcaceae bacterium SCADC1_2_3]